MKTRDWLILYLGLLLGPVSVFAQCENTIRTITYDTTIVGVGANGDEPYVFTFPLFDGDLGTLTDVNVATQLTLNYNYNVENTDPAVSKTFRFKMTRSDDILSPLLPGGALSYSRTFPNAINVPQNAVNYYSHTLTSADGTPGAGSDYASSSLSLLNQFNIISSSVNTANFIGTGNASFDYYTTMGTYRLNDQNTQFNSSATDEITLSITYTYCDHILLAANVRTFTATKKDNLIDVRWSTNNEINGKTYELQKSYDGQHFTTVGTFPSVPGYNQLGSYQYNYIPASSEKGKVIFRIKQIESDGTIKYSTLRVVDLGGGLASKVGLRISPNPSRGGQVNILFPDAIRSDWQVEVYNAAGQLLESRQFNNTLSARLSDTRLPRGLYLIKATNKKTLEKFIERLIAE